MAEKKTEKKKRAVTAKSSAARKRKRTGQAERRAAWIDPYIELVEKYGQLSHAAKLVNVHRKTIWQERKRNKDFRIAVADALRLYRERHIAELEEEILRRAKCKTPGEMDTKALIAALKAFAPDRWNPAKTQNVNLGGQPGNQLPTPPLAEQQITVIRITDIRNHADAVEFRRIQADRKVIEERTDDESEPLAPAIAHTNGNGNGKAKAAARGK